MKILILLLCVSFFEAYGQVKKSPNSRAYHDEQQIQGQSKEDSKTYMPGSLEGRQKSSSITGTTCIDGKGMEYTPTSTGYRKCVDQANRIRK